MYITYNIMERYRKGKFFRNFVPFMVLVIGGSFFIREFTQIKYKYRKVETLITREELIKHGMDDKKSTTLEEEYEKMKQMDIVNWENVRIARPWEESNSANN